MNLKMKIHSNLKIVKHVALFCLIVFTLIPCSVKVFLADSIETFYSKPVSNPKVLNNVNSCTYSDLTTHQNQIVQKKTVKKFSLFENSSKTQFVQIENKIFSENHFEFSGNSPPKYILFKRLKIAVTYS